MVTIMVWRNHIIRENKMNAEEMRQKANRLMEEGKYNEGVQLLAEATYREDDTAMGVAEWVEKNRYQPSPLTPRESRAIEKKKKINPQFTVARQLDLLVGKEEEARLEREAKEKKRVKKEEKNKVQLELFR